MQYRGKKTDQRQYTTSNLDCIQEADVHRYELSSIFSRMKTCLSMQLHSTPTKAQYETLKSLRISLSNESLKELNAPELLELIYLGLLGRAQHTWHDCMTAKSTYEYYLTYFDDDNFDIDKRWLQPHYQQDRSIKVAMSIRKRDLVKRYASVSISDLRQMMANEDDAIMDILLDWLMVLVIEAMQSMDLLDLESKMRDMSKNPPQLAPPKPIPQDGPVMGASGQVLRPFRLVDKKKENIFKPFHNVPTMSIEQYIDEEIRKGGIQLNVPSDTVPEIDADSESFIEAQRMKDIEWDAFKDDNPRGHGNRIGKG